MAIEWTTEIIVAAIGAGSTLLSGLVGVGGAIYGTKVGAKESQKATLAAAAQLSTIEAAKLAGDRIWELRRKSYSKIISSIEDSGTYWSLINDGFSEAGAQHAEAFYRDNNYDLWREKALGCWWKAQGVFSDNRVVFSEEFTKILSHITAKTAELEHDHDPPGEARTMFQEFREALITLTEISRAELIPKK